MTQWIVCLAVVTLAMTPESSASAQPFTPDLEAQYQAALAAWGSPSPPQCGSVHLEVQPIEEFNIGGGNAIARSTQPEPGRVLAECWLLLGREVAFEWTACNRQMVIDHEVGHMLGYSHTNDPSSIMYGGGSANASTTYCAGQEEVGQLLDDVWREVARCHKLPKRRRHRYCSGHVRMRRAIFLEAYTHQPPMPTFP